MEKKLLIQGTLGGPIKLLSDWLNKPLLEVAFRHHIKNILASDFYKNIQAKKNTAPENPFFFKGLKILVSDSAFSQI
jgi:hypothetical protein